MDNLSIIRASRKGYTEIVKILLADGRINPGNTNNVAIQVASKNGHSDVIVLLLADPRVNPIDRDNQAIYFACRKGHSEAVKLLLTDPRVNPVNVDLIGTAEFFGHNEIQKILLSDIRVLSMAMDINLCGILNKLVYYQLVEQIRILLADGRINPSDDGNSAIKLAYRNGFFEIVQILMGDRRVKNSLSKRAGKRYRCKLAEFRKNES